MTINLDLTEEELELIASCVAQHIYKNRLEEKFNPVIMTLKIGALLRKSDLFDLVYGRVLSDDELKKYKSCRPFVYKDSSLKDKK